MVKSLEEYYRSLRDSTAQRINELLSSVVQFQAELPQSVDFSAPPLSHLSKPWFHQFLQHPQIDSLLRVSLDYLFLCYDWKINRLPNSAPLERTCNRCLEILETHYQTGDREASAFRRFWELLLLPPIQSKQFSSHELGAYIKRCLTNSYGTEASKKLDLMLKQEFIPVNPAYEAVRRRYHEQLHAYYRKGFIYLLGEFDFNDFYIPPRLFPGMAGSQSEGKPVVTSYAAERWQHIFQKNSMLYIIGVPGSGKSLFLRNLINNHKELSFPNAGQYLVIYCDMKTYYTNGDSNQKSVPDFLRETIINTTGMEKAEISLEFIRYHLQMGRCLILMDALDEVPSANRLNLHKMVVSYFKGLHPDNKLCITSRARGFFPQEHIEVLHIPDLTEKDISNYLDKMISLGKFKAAEKKTFLSQAQVLIEKKFLTNFLILSLMVNIYKAERELPANKVELYKKCFEYIAKKREMEKGGKISYDWDLLSPMMKESTFISLSILAAPNNSRISRAEIEEMLLDQYRYKYIDEAKTESAIRQFLDFCSNRTDLFVLADADETFRFFHRSFFEYFYARYITQQPKVEDMYRLMSKFDEDSEVFELTLALLKEDNEGKYQTLVEYLLLRADREFRLSRPKYAAFRILSLSMPVIDDFYFHQKYLCLILDHPDLMSSNSIQKMNQRALAAATEKALQEFPDLAPQFQQCFEAHYITFVLQAIGALSPKFLKQLVREFQDSTRKLFSPVVTYHLSTQIPFYILAFPQHELLRDKVLHWPAEKFAAFAATLPPSRSKQSEDMDGLQYFASCSPENRKLIWECMGRQRRLGVCIPISPESFSPEDRINIHFESMSL